MDTANPSKGALSAQPRKSEVMKKEIVTNTSAHTHTRTHTHTHRHTRTHAHSHTHTQMQTHADTRFALLHL